MSDPKQGLNATGYQHFAMPGHSVPILLATDARWITSPDQRRGVETPDMLRKRRKILLEQQQ